MQASQSPRTLVLCFDGTGDLYDDTNTNVVKLFSLLKKDNKDQQVVYYQAGIGTYSAPGIIAGIQLWLAKIFDEAIAWYIDAHVMGGYEFLMQNYCAGDRICLFGFSRGAYTARALAGMLYKVGLLPQDNKEQVGFAYKMYNSTSKGNAKLAAGFKRTFCRTVEIEFIGCWDTVSTVGLFWGRHLPFTSGNASIKRFRHALSLDERRTKFQPNLWHREAPDDDAARLDPEHGSGHPQPDGNSDSSHNDAPTKQPDADLTDVLEVWFSGCHSDVGGGEMPSEAKRSLSNISLRWMMRQIVDSQAGIQFDEKALQREGIPHSSLIPGGSTIRRVPSSSRGKKDPAPLTDETQQDALDAVQKLHDALWLRPLWWLLEIVPTFQSWQDNEGVWHRVFRWNLARGRTIDTPDPKMHKTVKIRMADKALKYVPRAKWARKPDATWVE